MRREVGRTLLQPPGKDMLRRPWVPLRFGGDSYFESSRDEARMEPFDDRERVVPDPEQSEHANRTTLAILVVPRPWFLRGRLIRVLSRVPAARTSTPSGRWPAMGAPPRSRAPRCDLPP